MKTNLLTSLRKYRPRVNSDPLENFITEAFSWLLNNNPDLGKFFMRHVINELRLEIEFSEEDLVWETQENFNGFYPDMLCQIDDSAFIFEHKVWSHLHPNQLKNYRDYANSKYGPEKTRLILITGGVFQHDQKPDLAICWHNVYQWLSDWQQGQQGQQSQQGHAVNFLTESFKELLVEEGLGPPATISHESILSFYPAINFKKNLSQLISRVEKSCDWLSLVREGHGKIIVPKHKGTIRGEEWGRIGLQILDSWHPGIFVGFMLEGDDHKIKPLQNEKPDFSIIIDIDKKHHTYYQKNKDYLDIISELTPKLKTLGFDLHHHIDKDNNPNMWHPIHIRMSMLDLFRGTRNAAEQDQRFKEKATEVLALIRDCEPFWRLRAFLQKEIGSTTSSPISLPYTKTSEEN